MTSPVDGVAYPYISTEAAEPVRSELTLRLAEVLGKPVKIGYLFARMSPEGVEAPHQAHTDATMGQYSLMLYLNHRIHCKGGTSILRHRATGMDYHPRNELYAKIAQRDSNDYDAWEVTSFCPMRPNRAFIFDAGLFHRAEPVEGFGRDPRNARLVLTAFFSEAA